MAALNVVEAPTAVDHPVDRQGRCSRPDVHEYLRHDGADDGDLIE